MHRKLFYIFNFLILGTFMWSAALDYNSEWRPYQEKYFKMTADGLDAKAAKASDPGEAQKLRAEAKRVRHSSIFIRQIIVKDLGRVDRCVTCHVGMDEFANPTLTTEFKENPFKGHPDISGIVKAHPFQKFGCTSCHAGQGMATTVEAAHGLTENWEKPLLKGALLQSSCVKCHGDFEKLHGAEQAALGKKLFETHGCYGCHSINNWGQTVSVDLGDVADKPLERIAPYNLSLIRLPDGKPVPKVDWKLPTWIMAHLMNVPMNFIPNDPLSRLNKEPIAPSAMPDFTQEFSQSDVQAITAYLLSMTHEEIIPKERFVPGSPKVEPKFASAVEHGKFVFDKYGCAGCHGLGAKQGRRLFNGLGKGQPDPGSVKDDKSMIEAMALGREPNLVETLGTYTREELIKKIQTGVAASQINRYNAKGPVPPAYMPAWREKIKGQELEDLATYLMSIAKKEESW